MKGISQARARGPPSRRLGVSRYYYYYYLSFGFLFFCGDERGRTEMVDRFDIKKQTAQTCGLTTTCIYLSSIYLSSSFSLSYCVFCVVWTRWIKRRKTHTHTPTHTPTRTRKRERETRRRWLFRELLPRDKNTPSIFLWNFFFCFSFSSRLFWFFILLSFLIRVSF